MSWCGIFNTAGEQSAVRGDALEAGKRPVSDLGRGQAAHSGPRKDDR